MTTDQKKVIVDLMECIYCEKTVGERTERTKYNVLRMFEMLA